MRKLVAAWLCLLAFGCVAASSAVALPSILLLTGETGGSLLLESVTNIQEFIFETELSNQVNGEGVLLRLHFPNVNEPKGIYELLVTKYKYGPEAADTCRSMGDAAEEVLFPKRTFHLVYDSLTVLGVAVLLLIPQFKYQCKLSLTTTFLLSVEGNLLMLLSPINKEVLTSENLGIVSRCNLGLPKDKTWWNGAGANKTASLIGNVSFGLEPACLNIEGTVQMTVSKMAEVMG
jgi:hypothetical protein